MIEIIEGLEPWEVMKHASEGEPVAYFKLGWTKITVPHWNWGENSYAIIDTSVPVIDWGKFNWEFFNQYGGLTTGEETERFIHRIYEPTTNKDFTYNLVESPFYYWPGGECPVPGNVEVEVEFRAGPSSINTAIKFKWNHSTYDKLSDIIAFKLTGNIL